MHLYLLGAIMAAFIFMGLIERADNYEESRMEKRVQQLEILHCGLRQYEDYSVAPQRSDDIRARCVNLVTAPK